MGPLHISWRSFADFERYVDALPDEGQRGRIFEDFTRAYLLLTPELDLVEVWRIEDPRVPRTLLRRLGLRAQDTGVDFVGRRRDGSVWVVQAKYRADRQPITWRELSTFVGAGARADYRLLIGNQTALPRNRPLHLDDGGFGTVLREPLLALSSSFFARWRQLELSRQPGPRRRLRARTDQVLAIEAVVRTFTTGATRAQLIAACGTGKTLTALWLTERLRPDRVLFFTPSLALVHQTLKAWTEQASQGIDALCVCSDPSVGDVQLFDLPIPVTTEASAVRAFWKRCASQDRIKVIFATYQSAEVIEQALRRQAPAGLLVADEAHRVAGRDGKPFQAVLDDEHIPARRRLFMTATPRILANQTARAAGAEGVAVASMDDVELFGPVAHQLTFGAAIQLGLLVDYQIDALAVSDAEVRRLVRRRVFVDAEGEQLDAETLAQAVALHKAIRKKLLRYAFTFHHTKQGACTFQSALRHVAGSFGLFTDSVFGDMPVGHRQRILREMLTAHSGVVSSAKALSEGVDAPAVDAIVFADAKSSVVDIAQAVGRALRRDPRNPGKKAHIIVPLVLDTTDSPEAEVDGSAWEPVWNVLLAMRSHDYRLAAELDDAQRERGRRLGRRVRVNGPDGVLGGRLHLWLPPGVSLPRFERAVALRALDSAAETFEFGLGVLQGFIDREGHARPLPGHCEGTFRLGAWVSRQRHEFRKGRLSRIRAEQLQALPGWTWFPLEDDFAEGLQMLEQFNRREGHTRVPQTQFEGSFALGRWMAKRRGDYRDGRLAAERIAALERFPDWSWDPKGDDYQRGITLLQQYAAREGHTRVPAKHREDGFALGAWVGVRRLDYKKKRLDGSRRRELERMPGWSWDAVDDKFDRGLQYLRAFIKRTGHSRVQRDHVEDGFRLGVWVSGRRAQYRIKRLSAERTAMLEQLPGWLWNPKSDELDEGLERLRAYAAKHGHARVLQSYEEKDGFRLGAWVARRRRDHALGRLSPARKRALEAVPGWSWNTHATSFERGLQALRAFTRREGHSRVVWSHVEDGFRLGAWVAQWRRKRRQGLVSRIHAKSFEALPGWSWDPSQESSFPDGLAALRRFVAREKHSRVPVSHVEDGFLLGRWVSNKRQAFRQGRLSDAEVRALRRMPQWTWHTLRDAFDAALGHLRRFAKRTGHALVPQSHREDGFPLGRWVAKKRAAYRRGALAKEHVRALKGVPGWVWNVR